MALPLLLLVFSVSGAASGLENRFDAGIVLGLPTGVCARYFLSDTTSAGCALGYNKNIALQFDYLRYDFKSLNVDYGLMPFYYGGGLLITGEDFCVVLKAGLEYLFETNPLGIFLEIAPAAGTDFIFQAGLGVRYKIGLHPDSSATHDKIADDVENQ